MTLPEAQHVKALLGTLADHVPIQGTIGNGQKALYSISDAPNLHSTPSREEGRMFLALVRLRWRRAQGPAQILRRVDDTGPQAAQALVGPCDHASGTHRTHRWIGLPGG